MRNRKSSLSIMCKSASIFPCESAITGRYWQTILLFTTIGQRASLPVNFTEVNQKWKRQKTNNYKTRWYRGGHGFESRWSPDFFFFRLLLSNCLNWKIYCDDHISLSSTTAVQIWIISYKLHKSKTVKQRAPCHKSWRSCFPKME